MADRRKTRLNWRVFFCADGTDGGAGPQNNILAMAMTAISAQMRFKTPG
jgi:hypothetical protein